jgi:uroporphyrinogen-III synthase
LRRAASVQGARVLALSPWRLGYRDDAAARKALRDALSAEHVIFTSPAAVRAAAALQSLGARSGKHSYAVGSGTARALRRAGVEKAATPTRMDSEGLLALPQLREVRGGRVGLVTAPGGRGRIASALQRRGAVVVRADVYERIPVSPSTRVLATLRGLDAPLLLMLSSGEALARILAALPADVVRILRKARVVAASDRLQAFALEQGFGDIVRADNATPQALVTAAVANPPRRHAK